MIHCLVKQIAKQQKAAQAPAPSVPTERQGSEAGRAAVKGMANSKQKYIP